MNKILSTLILLAYCTLSIGQSNTKKNILFIAVDDLKPLINAYGESQMITPNFDRLAAMGTIFTNAHVQQAVCGPSRASVMTGTYPDRTKVWDLHTDFRKSAPDLISMPEYLISQGYETAGVGKIYHKGSSSAGHDGKSWSMGHFQPKDYDPKYGDAMFEYYQNPETKAKMQAMIDDHKNSGKKGKNFRQIVFKKFKPSTEQADVSDESYQDGLYTKKGIELLKNMNTDEKPFFLAVGFQKPHLPFVAPKKYWDLYKREDIKLAEFQDLSEGTPKIAYHNFGELRSYSDIDDGLDVGDKIDEAKQRELIHGYMACVSYIDAQLGKLLDALEDEGILESTIIALWGDHGFHLGDHTEWCKHSNFEQATRIPLMFAGPGIEQNLKIDHPVELLDIFPTIFEIANVKPSNQLEGISLLPLMDGNSSTTVTKDYAASQYRRGDIRMGYTIRTDRYRYTEWHENSFRSYNNYSKSNLIGRELYDYEKDPNETKNLIDNKDYKTVQQELESKFQDHIRTLNKKYNEI